ncbi:hypothetical protein EV356DRAFT_458297, partial [Viridothelium virens]
NNKEFAKQIQNCWDKYAKYYKLFNSLLYYAAALILYLNNYTKYIQKIWPLT